MGISANIEESAVDENALLNPSPLSDSYTTFSQSLASDELLASLSDFIEHTQPSKPGWKRQAIIKKTYIQVIQPSATQLLSNASSPCARKFSRARDVGK